MFAPRGTCNRALQGVQPGATLQHSNPGSRNYGRMNVLDTLVHGIETTLHIVSPTTYYAKPSGKERCGQESVDAVDAAVVCKISMQILAALPHAY